MAINLNDTLSMMQAIERSKKPASFLLDTFFPNVPTTATTKYIGIEYKKGARRLAPFITAGIGTEMERETTKTRLYVPPIMAPMRTITDYDVQGRAFGEAVLGAMTPEERASKLQARDFADLQKMIINRKNKMASELLTTGKVTVKGFADDGKTSKVDYIDFTGDWTQGSNVTTPWSSASATILDDITTASMAIQESAGIIPTVMICGKNIMKYMLNNTEMSKYLNIVNRENLTLLSLQPKLNAPQIGYLGKIIHLNLEMYSYMETYKDDDGTIKPFLGDNDVIIGIPGRGKQLHAAIDLVDAKTKTLTTYSGAFVPRYLANESANSLSLTMYSRCMLVPETCDDWACIHTTTTP